MTQKNQQQLGSTLWGIANDLRGAMNADDFRDYMLSFLFLRYLSSNYEEATKKELGSDYPQLEGNEGQIALTQLENRIRQHYVIQLVTLIVFTIGSQLLTSSHRVCP